MTVENRVPFVEEGPKIPIEVLMLLAVKEKDKLSVEIIDKKKRIVRLVNLSNGKNIDCQIEEFKEEEKKE